MTEIERNDVILMLHEKYFCELDLGLGDGDHGVTVSRGWKALSEALTMKLWRNCFEGWAVS